MPATAPRLSPSSRILDTGFSYDGSGNLTADGVNTMTYDAENRTVTTSGTGGSAEYKYDAQGLRVKKCVPDCANPTAVTISIYAGEQVIADYNGLATPPSLLREFIYYGDQLLAIEETTARRYMLRDHLSVRVTTDASGAKIGEQGHYPYGEDWYLVDTTTQRLFTTYQRDAQSGNDYAVHRYHASSLGRFTTADPVHGASAAPQSLNRYAYVGGDPVNRRDPRGLDSELGDGGGNEIKSLFGGFGWLYGGWPSLEVGQGGGAGTDPGIWNPVAQDAWIENQSAAYDPGFATNYSDWGMNGGASGPWVPIPSAGGGFPWQFPTSCDIRFRTVNAKSQPCGTGDIWIADLFITGIDVLTNRVTINSVRTVTTGGVKKVGNPKPTLFDKWHYEQDVITDYGGTVQWEISYYCGGTLRFGSRTTRIRCE